MAAYRRKRKPYHRLSERANNILMNIPYRTKQCRTKFFIGQNFRHLAKLSSLLSEHMLNSIVLKIFFGQNFRRTKLFVGQNFRHLRKISSLLSDIVLSDKVFHELFHVAILNYKTME